MSSSTLKLVVGLGNPGAKYENTRHNIGFDCLQKLHASMGSPAAQSKFESQITKGILGPHDVVLAWPMTYMNCSGRAVAQIARFYKIPAEFILVVCDDLSLPLGKLRLRKSGSSGGQKGLDDVLKALGTPDVPRLRIGIDATPENLQTVDYVLSKFSKKERQVVEESLGCALDAIQCWLSDGIDKAMNRFNASK
ncbi:MAG: aminoacyl-tRNA hydrolase [Planctomycetota bacterium]|nr:aminoacyl-tRNA hydrolase [Planctomycetota bacterium]